MPLSDIIQVSISVQSALVAQASFSIPMIVGSSNRFAERFRVYTGTAGMLADGFLTSDPEYLAAQELMSQPLTPDQFVIGRRLAEVAQVETITFIGDTNGFVYTATITDVNTGTSFACSFTSIGGGVNAAATGLAAAINAHTATLHVAAVAVGAVVTITAANPGAPFTIADSGTGVADMSLVHTTANHGIMEDLSDIRVAGASWYGTALTSRNTLVIELAARWTEANAVPPTLLVAQTSESASGSAALDPAGTDLANVLRARGYTRTAPLFHTLDGEYADAAWLGRELPITPGTDNWALKVLVGITPDVLSQTVRNNLIGSDVGLGKNANIYYSLTSQNPITMRGTVASGQWIDVIRFVDFLVARISEAVANLFLGQERVELDDFGIGQIVNQATGVLQANKDDHALVSYRVNAPLASAISSADRTARRLNPPITFSAQGSGALNGARIVGTITE